NSFLGMTGSSPFLGMTGSSPFLGMTGSNSFLGMTGSSPFLGMTGFVRHPERSEGSRGSSLLDVLRTLPFAARAVLGGGAEALGQRRVVVEPETDEGTRVGVGKVGLTENLERARCCARRVGDEAVDGLEAEDVRLVLLVAAVAGDDGHGELARE